MLGEQLLSHLTTEERATLGAVASLDEFLDDVIARAHAAWPGVSLSTEIFIRHLAGHLPGKDLSTLRGLDLFLACACGQGDRVALQVFEDLHGDEVSAVLAKMRIDAGAADELRQQVRHKLFVDGAIAAYSGAGELRAWLRVVLVRLTLNFQRGEKKHVALDEGLMMALTAPSGDPELELMKRAYTAEFRDAFQEAAASLGARDRNLLFLHFVDGLPIERVGAIHQVHRSTASRWLAEAQRELLLGTRRALMSRLSLRPDGLESVLRLIQSRIELNLETVLAATAGR